MYKEKEIPVDVVTMIMVYEIIFLRARMRVGESRGETNVHRGGK